jgi:signal transduction histidine kinase
MPLVLRDRVLGVLTVYSKTKHRFFQKEIVLLQNLALRAAAALENAYLTREALKRHDQIIDIAQFANPGYIALSFTHDAKHTMNHINALISALIDMTPRSLLASPPGSEIKRALEENTKYLKALFESLTNVAKQAGVKPKVVSLAPIFEDVEYLFHLKLRSIKFEAPPRQQLAADLECYPDQIAQVLINLINNSIDAIREAQRKDGVIRITVRTPELDKVELIVHDNGIGIPTGELDEVFKPIYSTKDRTGSGYGLAICKRIIEDNHGGQITLRSRQGEYTSVHITLPRRLGK